MANLPRLKETYNHIASLPNVWEADEEEGHPRHYPDSWDQSSWIIIHKCGTAACFAGWACILNGIKPEEMAVNDNDVAPWATTILGLDYHQTGALFNGGNSLADIRSAINEIAYDQGEGEHFIPEPEEDS